MQQRLAPMLFKDDDPATGKAARPSPVAPAQRSPSAQAKAAAKITRDGQPVHSFATRLADLATIAANRIQPAGSSPAPTQQRGDFGLKSPSLASRGPCAVIVTTTGTAHSHQLCMRQAAGWPS